MNWESFKKKFHESWHPYMKAFIESEECDNIFKLLKARSAEGGKIGPSSHNTFKAFEIPLDKIKVVIMGSRPYDGFIDGYPVANGLYLDCSAIGQVSYELRNFYRGLELELYNGLKLDYLPDTHNIHYLTEQGVMMMTASLTTEDDGDHDNLWFPFTSYVMNHIFSKFNFPIILLGDNTIPYTHFILDESRVFRLDEPKGVISEWDTKGVFQKVDNLVTENNQDTVMWLNIECPF